MSLIKCTECGNMISEYASSCPQCGCPIEIINKHSKYLWVYKSMADDEETVGFFKTNYEVVEDRKTLDELFENVKSYFRMYKETTSKWFNDRSVTVINDFCWKDKSDPKRFTVFLVDDSGVVYQGGVYVDEFGNRRHYDCFPATVFDLDEYSSAKFIDSYIAFKNANQ